MASADIELRVQTAVPLYRCRTVLIPVVDEQTACDPPFALAPFKLIGVAPAHHHFGLRAVFGGHQVIGDDIGFRRCAVAVDFDQHVADAAHRHLHRLEHRHDELGKFPGVAIEQAVFFDGCQAVPRLPVDVAALGCDYYVFSGHKLYGPTGIGVLWSDKLDALAPWQGGGSMIDRVTFERTTYAPAPTRFEAGTPAIVEALGLAAAVVFVAGRGGSGKAGVGSSDLAVPRLPVDVAALGCDYYVFSGHKLYGPTGIGVLWSDKLDALAPWQGGGSMIDRVTFERTTYAPAPTRFEAGTPAIVEALGLAAAVDYVAGVGVEAIKAHECMMVASLREALADRKSGV